MSYFFEPINRGFPGTPLFKASALFLKKRAFNVPKGEGIFFVLVTGTPEMELPFFTLWPS